MKKPANPGLPRPTKVCPTCGRSFTWRKAWARSWQSVKYCSDACRGRRLGPTDRALESSILRLLEQRAGGKTICPSEAARQVLGEVEGLAAEAMQRTRAAARRLVAAGQLVILQRGQPVDPDHARGPIRLRLKRP